jgi:ATP-dependent helicase HrpB
MEFPVDAVIPQLSEALAQGPSALLVAEPGAGKRHGCQTLLMRLAWARQRSSCRAARLAARAAHRMADTLGEEIGEIGYTVASTGRSGRTRIEVV